MSRTIGRKEGVAVTALVLGAATSIGCSIAFGFLYGFIVALALGPQSMPVHEFMFASKAILASTIAAPAIMAIACTVLGGCVAGLFVRHDEVLYGGLVGVIDVMMGLLWSLAVNPQPLLLQLGALFITVPAGMAGGFLANRYRDSATIVVRRLLFGLIWLVVFYYGACIVVGTIGGGIAIAGIQGKPGGGWISYGRFYGRLAVASNINFIACGSLAAAFLGAGLGLLPGTRCRRQPERFQP